MEDGKRQILISIGLVTLGGILFVVMNAMVKSLTERYPLVMLLWGRTFFHVLFVALVVPSSVIGAIRTADLRTQLLRGILLGGSTVLNFAALYYLPLGDVAAITFLSPIMVAGLAVIILRERVGIWRWLAIGAGFAGALLIVRPTGAGINLGAGMALGCAACFAVYQVSTRMVRESHPYVSLLFSGVVGAALFSLMVPFHWQTPTAWDFAMLVLSGVLGASGHFMIILALQRGEASKVSPFNYVQLIWAMLASYVAFGDIPRFWTLVGAGVIVASGLWLYQLSVREQAAKAQLARAGS